MRAWLSPAGTACALAVGIAVAAGTGWRGVVLLFVFLSTSSLLTKGGGRRRPSQVLANGGAAALCALLAPWQAAFAVACSGAIATAAADTWATEIGGRSRTPPRLITTGRPVPAGTSGGVTPLGTGGAALGALAIAAAAALVGLVSRDDALWVAVGGLAGALLDSLLGAVLQARWRCFSCGVIGETRVHHDVAGVRVSGLAWLDNDGVNAVATLAGALVAGLPAIIRGATLA